MMERGRCVWEVTAGILPGTPEAVLTRRWGLTGSEWERADAGKLFEERLRAAMDYAKELQEPRLLNWVRLDWIWF